MKRTDRERELGIARCLYDGNTADCYTVVLSSRRYGKWYSTSDHCWLQDCIGLSDNPLSPQGFNQMSSCQLGFNRGKRITFDELPEPVKRAIVNRLTSD